MRLVLMFLTCTVLYAAAAIGQRAPSEVPVNNVLPLLEQDKPIFGHMVNYMGIGSDRQSAIAHSQERETDFVIYDLEHSAFDISALGDYMQWLLDRGTIARSGTITPSKSVFVRVPVNGREMNQWVIKNVLDEHPRGQWELLVHLAWRAQSRFCGKTSCKR